MVSKLPERHRCPPLGDRFLGTRGGRVCRAIRMRGLGEPDPLNRSPPASSVARLPSGFQQAYLTDLDIASTHFEEDRTGRRDIRHLVFVFPDQCRFPFIVPSKPRINFNVLRVEIERVPDLSIALVGPRNIVPSGRQAFAVLVPVGPQEVGFLGGGRKDMSKPEARIANADGAQTSSDTAVKGRLLVCIDHGDVSPQSVTPVR